MAGEVLSTNLPLALTSFIGRERELAQIKRLLSTTRLLTLTGAGGCGKTRLALQVASDLEDDFADGVWLVDLAPINDPPLVPRVMSDVLGIRETLGTPLIDTLVESLGSKTLLIVLDNCEHLIDPCARLVESVLRTCPHVKFLATSREPLAAAGETTFRVPSLGLPDSDQLPPVDTLANVEAVHLFVDRAIAARSDFRLTDGNARAVTQICLRLDGMPLAIELAASRVTSLSVEKIAARLDDRFHLLTSGGRTVLPRQKTLQATVDWSYDLLSLQEQMLLCRSSVFAGGWTLEAAEEVCSGDGVDAESVLGLQSQLVDKSLVIAEEHEGAVRYHLLETIRQYAYEKQSQRGLAARWRDRHLAFFLKFAVRENALWDLEPQASNHHMETDHSNLRAALAWSLESEKTEAGLDLASTLWWFWHMRGYLVEGSEWLRRMLDATRAGQVSSSARARALQSAGGLAWRAGDIERSVALCEESLALCRELGDKQGMAFSLGTLGMAAWLRTDYASARAFFQQGLMLRRETNDKVGYSLRHLGMVAWCEENYEQAAELCEKAVAWNRKEGSRWELGDSLTVRGTVARSLGDYALACSSYEESLAIQRVLGDKWNTAYSLEGIACVCAARRQPERAASLWGAAEALRETIHAPIAPAFRRDYASIIARARTQIGQASFAKMWDAGRALSLEPAIEHALAAAKDILTEAGRKGPPKGELGGLTEREREVAALIAEGKSNREIAESLVVVVKTVEVHVTHILDKLGFSSRTEIAGWAIRKGLAPPPKNWEEEIR